MISFEDLGDVGFKDVFSCIDKVCSEFEVQYFVIGALARNLWYLKHGGKARDTKDIDFAVQIHVRSKFDSLRNHLIEKYNYRPLKENSFCLISPEGYQVDILPFGEITQNGLVSVKEDGLHEIHMQGFSEIHNSAIEWIEIEGVSYPVCSMPAMVLLKLIAYDDRPEMRTKDALDVNNICIDYPDYEDDYIYKSHSELYGLEHEHDDVGQIVIGRKVAEILTQNTKLKTRVVQILERAIAAESKFCSAMIIDSERETIDEKAKILKNIRQGLTE